VVFDCQEIKGLLAYISLNEAVPGSYFYVIQAPCVNSITRYGIMYGRFSSLVGRSVEDLLCRSSVELWNCVFVSM